jgi:hypothetical protein
VVGDRDQLLACLAHPDLQGGLCRLARGRAGRHLGVVVEGPAAAAAVDVSGDGVGHAVVDQPLAHRRGDLAPGRAGGLADGQLLKRDGAVDVGGAAADEVDRVVHAAGEVVGEDARRADVRAGEAEGGPAAGGGSQVGDHRAGAVVLETDVEDERAGPLAQVAQHGLDLLQLLGPVVGGAHAPRSHVGLDLRAQLGGRAAVDLDQLLLVRHRGGSLPTVAGA